MEPIQGSETSAFNNNQTPGKYPEELLLSLQHGESLKHRTVKLTTAHNEERHNCYLFEKNIYNYIIMEDVMCRPCIT